MEKAVKKKKKDKNVGCAIVQSHIGRVSEVSCDMYSLGSCGKEEEIDQGLLPTERQ